MTFGAYTFSMKTLLVAALASVWLLATLAAAALPSTKKKNYALRRVDVVVFGSALVFGVSWFLAILHESRHRAIPSTVVRRCLLAETGQSESKVKELAGAPDRIISGEDLRGPGSDVWIYKNERCVVHFLEGKVISVE
jgi:hypothetical protein